MVSKEIWHEEICVVIGFIKHRQVIIFLFVIAFIVEKFSLGVLWRHWQWSNLKWISHLTFSSTSSSPVSFSITLLSFAFSFCFSCKHAFCFKVNKISTMWILYRLYQILINRNVQHTTYLTNFTFCWNKVTTYYKYANLDK